MIVGGSLRENCYVSPEARQNVPFIWRFMAGVGLRVGLGFKVWGLGGLLGGSQGPEATYTQLATRLLAPVSRLFHV